MEESSVSQACIDATSDKNAAVGSTNTNLQPLLNTLSSGGSISDFWNTLKEWSEDDLQSAVHDTVPVVYKLLGGDYTETGTEDVTTVLQLLGEFADVCEPKEFLLLLIEQAQEDWTGCKFVATVATVGGCINRMMPPRTQSVTFAVDAFTKYLECLPVPSVDNLEGRERMLLDGNPMVHRVCSLFPKFLEFIQPLAEEISWTNKSNSQKRVGLQRQVDVLSSSLCTLLGRPLGRLDLTGRGTKRSEPRTIAEDCLSLLSLLHRDFVRVVLDCRNSEPPSTTAGTETQSASNDNSKNVTLSKLTTFAFLAFGERVTPKCLPYVYSHQFFLEFCAPIIVLLFKETDMFPVLHGIQFCASLLARIETGSLPVDVLESDDLQHLALAVVRRAATAKTKELRSSMLRLLSTICRVLDSAARNQYLYVLLKISPRAGGVVGHVITMLSDEILANIGNAGKNYFGGSELERLLHLVFALPSGEKTDLMENSERIMAAMKLLKVVLPLDRISDNRTGIWNVIPLIEWNYLRTLHAAIELSKSHYELEIRHTREKRSKDVAVCHARAGRDASLSKRQQLGVLEMSVHTLEMMESVACQVGNVIDAARKDGPVDFA